MLKLTVQEIAILRLQNDNPKSKVIFTEDELEKLTLGTAPLRVMNEAEKAIKAHHHFMNTPPSRQELSMFFLRKTELEELIEVNITPVVNRIIAGMNVLIEKSIITEAEIDKAEQEGIARQMPHLCKVCSIFPQFPECGEAKPRFSIDVLPLLTGELADKVVQCTGFTQEEPKVNDGSAEEAQA